MQKFLKENWFKLILVISIVVVAWSVFKLSDRGLNIYISGNIDLCAGKSDLTQGLTRAIGGTFPDFCK